MLENERTILVNHINKIREISNKVWISNLEERKLKELQFHNRDRDVNFVEEAKKTADTYEKFYGNKKYYSITKRSTEYTENWIKKNAKNKVFLDYACGNGLYARKASEFGAKLSIGLDISDISIKNAINTSSKLKIKNIEFFQADAENTKLPDNSIDTIICSGMLHHLDLSFAFPELRRILKPGGKILAIEALDYNPLIKLYRFFTPDMRTEWEKAHILSLKDISFASRFFKVSTIKYWHITEYVGAKINFLKPILSRIDPLLENIPLVKLLAWIFTFELIKEK